MRLCVAKDAKWSRRWTERRREEVEEKGGKDMKMARFDSKS